MLDGKAWATNLSFADPLDAVAKDTNKKYTAALVKPGYVVLADTLGKVRLLDRIPELRSGSLPASSDPHRSRLPRRVP